MCVCAWCVFSIRTTHSRAIDVADVAVVIADRVVVGVSSRKRAFAIRAPSPHQHARPLRPPTYAHTRTRYLCSHARVIRANGPVRRTFCAPCFAVNVAVVDCLGSLRVVDTCPNSAAPRAGAVDYRAGAAQHNTQMYYVCFAQPSSIVRVL